MTAALSALVDPGWAEALAPVEPTIRQLGDFLRKEVAEGRQYVPASDLVLRAFQRPIQDARVLIVGQDPYPSPGHAVGLSFSVGRGVRVLPGSLRNIYKELEVDLGIPPAAHGDLSRWADQGVVLLNRVLTTQSGKRDAHRGEGWESVTEHAIRVLGRRPEPLVAVLWGNAARSLAPMLAGTPIVESAHPSNMSARKGFFGSRPFSRVNELLQQQGAAPIDWRLE